MPVDTSNPNFVDCAEAVLRSLTAKIAAARRFGSKIPGDGEAADLQEFGREFAEFFRARIHESFTVEPAAAIREHDEENPGKYKIIFKTRDGSETLYRNLPSHLPKVNVDQPVKTSDPWSVLQDDGNSVPVRLSAIAELHASEKREDVTNYVIHQLGQGSLSVDWRDALVFVAESIHFPPSLRPQVGERLLELAGELRAQPEGREKVVWSALRRGASLTALAFVNRLLPFLISRGSVDTRAVALEGIARVFEPDPPMVVPHDIADRVAEFAKKFLDPVVFTPGELSLIGRNAIAALAAVGDSRLSDAIDQVNDLGRPWLTRRVQTELRRLRASWGERGINSKHTAIVNVENALGKLK
jgi:hypothetical protein